MQGIVLATSNHGAPLAPPSPSPALCHLKSWGASGTAVSEPRSSAAHPPLSDRQSPAMQGIVFATVGGLRGALCLIMVQTVMLDMGASGAAVSEQLSAVKASLALWTAGVVICTLTINAPSLQFVLRVTGLTKVSVLTLQARDRARRAFLKFTADAVARLRRDEDDLFKVRLRPPQVVEPAVLCFAQWARLCCCLAQKSSWSRCCVSAATHTHTACRCLLTTKGFDQKQVTVDP